MSPIDSIELDLCFFIQSQNVCFLIRLFNSFIFHIIIDMIKFMTAILFIYFYKIHIWTFLSLTPSFVNECFQGSIWFALMVYINSYFLSDYSRACHIHINLALLHICTHLTTVRIIINVLVNSELNWKGMGEFSSNDH